AAGGSSSQSVRGISRSHADACRGDGARWRAGSAVADSAHAGLRRPVRVGVEVGLRRASLRGPAVAELRRATRDQAQGEITRTADDPGQPTLVGSSEVRPRYRGRNATRTSTVKRANAA